MPGVGVVKSDFSRRKLIFYVTRRDFFSDEDLHFQFVFAKIL